MIYKESVEFGAIASYKDVVDYLKLKRIAIGKFGNRDSDFIANRTTAMVSTGRMSFGSS